MKPKGESGTLIEEMKQYLPIPARPTKEICKASRQEGRHLDPDQEIDIVDVFDSGDTGGIVCVIGGDEEHLLVISLTHLKVKPDHPLSDKVAAYQKKRVKRLRRFR